MVGISGRNILIGGTGADLLLSGTDDSQDWFIAHADQHSLTDNPGDEVFIHFDSWI